MFAYSNFKIRRKKIICYFASIWFDSNKIPGLINLAINFFFNHETLRASAISALEKIWVRVSFKGGIPESLPLKPVIGE